MAGVRATDTGVLWAAVLAGPVAWSVQLLGVFALSAPAGEGWSEVPLHVVSLLCLLTAAGGAFLAHRGWRTVGGWPSAGDEAAAGRTRFLTVLSQLTGAFFAVVILAQWTAAMMLPAHPTGAT